MSKYPLIILATVFVLAVPSCTSHKPNPGAAYDKSDTGATYTISDGTLVVLVKRYQFVPNTAKLMLEGRTKARQIAKEKGLKISRFDTSTNRNPWSGVTSATVMGEIEE